MSWNYDFWESKFRKDYPRLKSYYVDSKSNEDEKLNLDEDILMTYGDGVANINI